MTDLRAGAVAQRSRPAAPRGSRAFRADLDGLRAVAVLAVVAYHAHVAGFGGGFVGVDVFFVISGFLITRNLSADRRASAALLVHFWARRVRRLIPALTVVTLVTLLVTVATLPVTDWHDVGVDSAWSAAYLANVHFQRLAQGYFTADLGASFVLHTWSLAVEEQFYLLWPLLFVAARWVARRTRREPVVGFGIVVAAATAASLVASNLWTDAASPSAFYSVWSRAWEFGVAAMVALALERRPAPPALVRAMAGWSGAGLVAVALVVVRPTTPYPGVAALLPVLGTAGLIVGGSGGALGISRRLAAMPLQRLGRLSYSWYLWHWPAIQFAVAWWGDATHVRVVASVASLAPAAACYLLIERPVRFSARLASRPSRTFVFAAGATALTVAAALWIASEGARRTADDPFLRRVEAASGFVDHPRCTDDLARPECSYGDVGSSRSIVLIGDSHASHWLAGFDAAARRLGMRLVVEARPHCPIMGPPNAPSAGVPVSDVCRAQQAASFADIASVRPGIVVISNYGNYSDAIGGAGAQEAASADVVGSWRTMATGLATYLQGSGIRTGFVLDGPAFPHAPNLCARREHSFAPCGAPLREVARPTAAFREATRAGASAVPGVQTLDALELQCDAARCPAAIGELIVYADSNHVTEAFAASRAPEIERFLRSLGA